MQLLIFPMIFVSGVFFPINNVPTWLEVISKLNPLTYGVDAIRHAFLDGPWAAIAGNGPSPFGVAVFGHQMTMGQDALVIVVTGAVLLSFAVTAFNRQE